MAQTIEQLLVDLKLNTAGIAPQLQQFNTQVKTAMGGVESTLAKAKTAFAALGVSIAAVKLGALAKDQINVLDRFSKLNQSTGESVEKLSAYSHAADLAGLSTEDLAGLLARLTAKGVDVEKLSQQIQNMTPQQAILRLQELGLKANAAAAAIPFLRQNLAEAREEAERLGLVVDQKTARSAETLNDNLTRLSGALRGLLIEGLKEVLPLMERFSNSMVASAKESGGARETVGDFAKVFASIGVLGGQIWQKLGLDVKDFAGVTRLAAEGDYAGAIELMKTHMLDLGDLGERTAKDLAFIWASSAERAAIAWSESMGRIRAEWSTNAGLLKELFPTAFAGLAPSGAPPAARGKKADFGVTAFGGTPTLFRPEEAAALFGNQQLNELVRDLPLAGREFFNFAHQAQLARFAIGDLRGAFAEAAEGAPNLTDLFDRMGLGANRLADGLRSVGERASSAFRTALIHGEGFRGVLQSMLADLASLSLNSAFRAIFGGFTTSKNPFLAFLGGLSGFAGGRQHGGPVIPGHAYLVGERGPELFLPRVSGTIAAGAAAGAGGGDVHFHMDNRGADFGTVAKMQAIGIQIGRQLTIATLRERQLRTV